MDPLTISRLVKDVKQLMKCPLISNGIYYVHDDSNITKGYAMIVGPKQTPYENGLYFFDFDFPSNYPFSPPICTFRSGNMKTRFNPNLYVFGAVCLSILNTWKGEQWTACQTISSVLLQLIILFNDNPLFNEPGVTRENNEIDIYNEIIHFKNIEVNVIDLMRRLKNNNLNPTEIPFVSVIQSHFENCLPHVFECCCKMAEKQRKNRTAGNVLNVVMYPNMSCSIDYSSLIDELSQFGYKK